MNIDSKSALKIHFNTSETPFYPLSNIQDSHKQPYISQSPNMIASNHKNIVHTPDHKISTFNSPSPARFPFTLTPKNSSNDNNTEKNFTPCKDNRTNRIFSEALENNNLNFKTEKKLSQDNSAFLIRDKDTGEIYDIREIDQVDKLKKTHNPDYFSELKKKKKHIWRTWWHQKRKNNKKLLEAIQNNNLVETERLLDEKLGDLKAEVNYKNKSEEMSSLHYAAINGNYNICLLILKHDADIQSVNNQTQTPFLLACQKGHHNVVSLLITAGCDINFQDETLNTGLHYACIFNHYEVIETLLLRPSINIYLKNINGKEPIDIIKNSPEHFKKLFEKYLENQKISLEKKLKIEIFKSNQDNVNEMFQKIQNSNTNSNTNKFHENSKLIDSKKIDLYPKNIKNDQCDYNSPCFKSKPNKIGPEDFLIISELGSGSFGEVYLVQKKKTSKERFAMKVLQKKKNNLVTYALTERNVLSIMDHPFIVKLNFSFQTSTNLFLIMEYCEGGDLYKYLVSEKKFSEEKMKFYICGIILALEHLHKNDIIYRDLKPENVVLDSEGYAKLTDFGLSKEGVLDERSAKSFCGSLCYMAPEILKRSGHGKSVDWYLLGVMMYELVVGEPPYFNPNRNKMFLNIEKGELTLPEFLTPNLQNLLKSLLERNPLNRIGAGKKDAEEIKSHSFFNNINWDDFYQKKYLPPILPSISNNKKNSPVLVKFEEKDKTNPQNIINGWSFVNTNSNN